MGGSLGAIVVIWDLDGLVVEGEVVRWRSESSARELRIHHMSEFKV